jgi:hypothetical protein
MTLKELLLHFPGIFILIALIPIVILDLWAIIDISRNSYKKLRKKWLWTNIVMLFPVFGVLAYIFIGRRILKTD